MKRTVIIGNSGSGKTFLARRISASSGIAVIHLDNLFWLPGGFSEKRPAETVDAEIASIAQDDEWIVEGVFGDLAEKFLGRADHLIWLDLPWSVCRAGLMERGSESSKQREPAAAEAYFTQLLAWAEGYWNRTGSCSHSGHLNIFEKFPRAKHRIAQRLVAKTRKNSRAFPPSCF